jgi:hypothetical protein
VGHVAYMQIFSPKTLEKKTLEIIGRTWQERKMNRRELKCILGII